MEKFYEHDVDLLFLFIDFKPVSYTHLDVYKRQPQDSDIVKVVAARQKSCVRSIIYVWQETKTFKLFQLNIHTYNTVT